MTIRKLRILYNQPLTDGIHTFKYRVFCHLSSYFSQLSWKCFLQVSWPPVKYRNSFFQLSFPTLDLWITRRGGGVGTARGGTPNTRPQHWRKSVSFRESTVKNRYKFQKDAR